MTMGSMPKLLGLLFILQFGNIQGGGCVGDAVAFGSQCLTISNEGDKRNWVNAKAACAGKNGRLAKLEHPVAVYDHVIRYYHNEDPGYEKFYVGASDIANEGSWLWIDGTALDRRFPWRATGNSEPNGGRGENCLVLAADPNHAYIDAGCGYKFRYICEDLVPECPLPWILVGNQCIRVVAEQPGSRWKTWSSARAHCRAWGGDLAQPKDLKPLADHLFENYTGHSWWWLGGSDLDRDRDWRWINGNTIGSTGWYTGQPERVDDDCLMFWHGNGAGSSLGNLYAKGCDAKLTFVCERH